MHLHYLLLAAALYATPPGTPTMTPQLYAEQGGLHIVLYPMTGTSQVTGYYVFGAAARNPEWPQWSFCTSVLAHRGEPDMSFLTRIDDLGGWRNASCPDGRCYMQFGVPSPKARSALGILGEYLGRRVTPGDIIYVRERWLAQGQNVPAALTNEEIARTCNVLLDFPGTLILVGDVGSLTPGIARGFLPWYPDASAPQLPRPTQSVLEASQADWVPGCTLEMALMKIDFESAGLKTPDNLELTCIGAILLRTVP